ncbi:MAG: polymer-forming cytoskeletal protein, partial [Phycisphaerae bacterium]|nr:polymer-forming cytoskeletal protein [Phycisphaerae bacterium]
MLRLCRFTLPFVCVVLFASGVAPAHGEEVFLSEVPAYNWTHGCSPTAGMMIMGYWDAHGYSALIPGSNSWSTNQIAIRNALAGPEHVSDYALYDGVNDMYYSSPYTDKSELGGAHADNCLADFMRTSRSSEGLTYGSSWTHKIGIGMEDYTSWRGYSFTAGGDYSSMPTWAEFTHEILMGRPVKLSVDSNGDGETDHSVTAIGFRDTYGYQEYACRDTWSTSSTPRWERFRGVSSSYDWGINGMDTFRPGETRRDTMWTSASGNWQDSGWSAGVPNPSVYACITDNAGITISAKANAGYVMNRGTIDIQGGTFTVGTLGSAGLTNQSAGSVHASGSVAVGANGAYALSGGTLEVDSELDVSGELTLSNGGSVEVGETLKIWSTGTVQGDGTITANVIINAGTVKPGISPGTLSVNGDYTQEAAGSLEIEIGGLSAGSQHDQVAVTGTANLAGILELSLIGEYVPDFYDEFEILTAGTLNGTFDTITGYSVNSGMSLATVYNANDVTVVAAIPG